MSKTEIDNNKIEKEIPEKSGRRTLVKCLVCGEIFDSSLEICPVCGVGKENFIPYEEEIATFTKDTKEVFVILGNGVSGISAGEAIRERNKTCSIIIISNEPYLSYNRPMLTKSLLTQLNSKNIAIHNEEWYNENHITNMLGIQVEKIDVANKEIMLSDNNKIHYDKCIYAIGAECFIPPITGYHKPEVIAIRRIADIEKIKELLPKVKNVVVIGGGVLGLEAAWEINNANCKVSVLEISEKIMGRQLDDNASKLLKEIAEDMGIEITLNAQIGEILGEDTVTGVRLEDGSIIPAELVVISAGIRANVGLAKEAGITVDRGIVVDERMQTNVQDVYACGDCAEYMKTNYAIWPEALEMGEIAGANAAGDNKHYENTAPALTFNGMNTSLFSLGDNGTNPDLQYQLKEVKEEDKKTYEKYYYVDHRLVGVILIGDTKKLIEMTDAVKEKRSYHEMWD